MRATNVDFMTIGQFLQLTPKRHRVNLIAMIDEFKAYECAAFGIGFAIN